MTVEDIDQIVEGIEYFIIGGDDDLAPIWQPYIDKLQALKAAIANAEGSPRAAEGQP